MTELTLLSWDDVKPIWDTKLWIGRDSVSVVPMMYLSGHYDMSYKDHSPSFPSVVDGDKIVAVNSYVRTRGGEFRCRGLWVDPEYRGQGHAKRNLEWTLNLIKGDGGTFVWTVPRQDALPAYESVGFIRTSDWFETEWGKNCYAVMPLRTKKDLVREAKRIRQRRKNFYNKHLKKLVEVDGVITEEARQVMRRLADEEESEWR